MHKVDKFSEGIAVDICFSCNNNCLFCVNPAGKSRKDDLSTEEVENRLHEVREFSEGVIINGGEPTIREDIVELIGYARNIGFKSIMMISNGRMFSYDNFCKRLFIAGLRLVFVTLQASNAKLHDKMTNVKGSFHETVKGIKNLKKNGIEVCTNTVINKLNYKNLPQMPFLLSKLKISFAKFSFIRIKGIAEENLGYIVPKITDIVPYVKLTADNFIKMKKDFSIQEIQPCVMKSHIQYIRKGPKMPLINNNDYARVSRFKKRYSRGGNIKRKECKRCICYAECLGPWKEYVRYFGWDEFKPVTDEKTS